MADKKVERSGRERPLTPRQKMTSALSDAGTVNVSEFTHDKGKSALVDKFREREERWRREQALQDRASDRAAEQDIQGPAQERESAESTGQDGGGDS